MIKKKIALCLLILFLIAACEYKPIYSQKNTNFSITKLEIIKKDIINFKIKNRLKIYQNEKGSKKYDLTVDSQKIISITSKDKKSDAKTFNMEISVSIIVKDNISLTLEKTFIENFNYNTDVNKINLREYEKTIQNNLINKIADNISAYLFSL